MANRTFKNTNKIRKQVTLSPEAIRAGKRIGKSEKPKRNFSNTLEMLLANESDRRFMTKPA